MVAPALAEARKQTAQRLLQAISAKDRGAASDCLADDVTWWVPQSAAQRFGIERPIRRRDAVLDLLCGPSRYAPGTMNWNYHAVLADDDFVIVHCTLQARTRDGADYENHYCLLYRFEGERVAESWEHTDTAYAFGQFDA